jgi:hypothetical protein
VWTGSGGALVNTETNLLVPQNNDIFFFFLQLLAFQEDSHGLSKETTVCCCSWNPVEVAAIAVGLLAHEILQAVMQQTVVFIQ